MVLEETLLEAPTLLHQIMIAELEPVLMLLNVFPLTVLTGILPEPNPSRSYIPKKNEAPAMVTSEKLLLLSLIVTPVPEVLLV